MFKATVFFSLFFFLTLSSNAKELDIYINEDGQVESLSHFSPFSSEWKSAYNFGNFAVRYVYYKDMSETSRELYGAVNPEDNGTTETQVFKVGDVSNRVEWISTDGGMYIWWVTDNLADLDSGDRYLVYVDPGYSLRLRRVNVENRYNESSTTGSLTSAFQLKDNNDVFVTSSPSALTKMGPLNVRKLATEDYNKFTNSISPYAGTPDEFYLGFVRTRQESVGSAGGMYLLLAEPLVTSEDKDSGYYLFCFDLGYSFTIRRVVIDQRYVDDKSVKLDAELESLVNQMMGL